MKILFVHQGLQSFVKKDLDILQEAHEVRVIEWKGGLGGIVTNLLPLWKGTVWCDLTFSWFGKLNAFFTVLFSKLLRKGSVVVAGGDDVGIWIYRGRKHFLCSHPVKRWFPRFIFRNADWVIAISGSNYDDVLANAGASKEKVELIYHGFDNRFFKKAEGVKRLSNRIITVSHVTKENFVRKGVELFIHAAMLLPEYEFIVVGQLEEDPVDLAGSLPVNVFFAGPKYGKELVEVMSSACVYVQASYWESFGCSLAEAMLCECVPVVSRLTSLPEVASDSAYYIDKMNPDELAKMIVAASKDKVMGKYARQRIVDIFPLEKRENKILEKLRQLHQ